MEGNGRAWQSDTHRPTRWGNSAAAMMLCMPPREEPIVAWRRSIPSESTSRNWQLIISSTATRGKAIAYCCPVVGLIEEGPVLP